jgi:hypothetical protein
MNKYNIDNNNSTKTAPRMATAVACQNVGSLIDRAKREVFAEYQSVLGANEQLLRLAIAEADALARQTGYPHLFFPMLAAEKAKKAARWQFHQQFLLRTSDPLAA